MYTDWNNKKSITDTSIAQELGLTINSIRRIIRDVKIIKRKITNGLYITLRKNN